MTSEAKPLFPWLSPNQLATRELYKLVWKWFLSKLREPVGLKLLLQIIVKLHLWHLGFTFISNCLMPDYTSHISYKRYKLGTVQNRTLKMEGWTQKFCVNWWSGLAEKYLITTGNILGACQQAMPEDVWIHLIISPTPPLGGKSSWLVFLHPFLSPSVHSHLYHLLMHQVGNTIWEIASSHTAPMWPEQGSYPDLPDTKVHAFHHWQSLRCIAIFLVLFLRLPRLGSGVKRRELLPLQPHCFSYS